MDRGRGSPAEPDPAVPRPARGRTAADAAPAALARGRRHLRRRIPSWPEVTEIFSFMPTVDNRACPARKRRVNRRVEWSGGVGRPGGHMDDRRGHMPNALRLGLLGPPQVRDDTGRLVSVGGRQLRVLFTLFAVNAGRVVPAASI